MKIWRNLATGLLISLVAVTTTMADDAADDDGWVQLFNGKDLTGWKVKITGYDLGDNFGDTFRVEPETRDNFGDEFRAEKGLLTVSFDKYDKFDGRFGHIFYEKPFSNYRLRVEYRFIGEQTPGGAGWAFRNSGIMIHGQSPESMRKDQDFPVSIEVQLLGGDGTHPRPTGNLCTPGTNFVNMDGELVTRHCNSSTSKTYHGDQWVTIEVEVHGNKLIKHLIDGETVMEYTKPQLDEKDKDAAALIKDGDKMLYGGTISLQAESHPCQFRKVEIKELKE